MSNPSFARIAAAAMLCLAAPVESQPSAPPSYADLADLAVAAPVAAHVRLKRAVALKGPQAAGVPAGATRFYIVAEVISLVRGPGGIPIEVSYLVDLPNLPNGKAAKPQRKSEHIVIAATVPGRPGELRLVSPGAQLPYTPALADRLRAMLREASAPGAPPAITGIGRAFHVPGTLPGESETQIFLLAADGRPISLTIVRRPGEQPRWGVALTEIVDEAAAPPARDTLLWYRLACALPRQLPAAALSDADPGQADAIRADYGFVLQSLGACVRTRAAV